MIGPSKFFLFSIDRECPFPHKRLLVLDWFVPLWLSSWCPSLVKAVRIIVEATKAMVKTIINMVKAVKA